MTDRYYPDIVDHNLEMQQAIERVRELHKPDNWNDCEHCSIIASPDGNEYLSRYPCPTIKALDGEQ